MSGIVDRIGDLSWLGADYADMGWFVVGDASVPASSTKSEIEWEKAKQKLRASDWSMLPDVPMTAGKKSEWIEYRKALREIRLQSGFPENINWPTEPN